MLQELGISSSQAPFFWHEFSFFFFFQPFHMNTALCRLKGLKGVMAKMGDTIGVRVHNR